MYIKDRMELDYDMSDGVEVHRILDKVRYKFYKI